MMKIEVYKDKRNEFRWRILARNGKIVADSAEGYTRHSNVRRAINRFMAVFFDDEVRVVDEFKRD